MKYYLEKATIKNIVTILTLILFSVILFYRYTIINGIDNLQLFSNLFKNA